MDNNPVAGAYESCNLGNMAVFENSLSEFAPWEAAGKSEFSNTP